MLHRNFLKRYVPRQQSLIPLDQDISLGGDVKEHGIQDWEIELESGEEDSQDEIPRGPHDLVELEEDSQDEIPRRTARFGGVRRRRQSVTRWPQN